MTSVYECQRSFFLRRFQSLLGIIPIGAFLLEHAFTNSMAYFYGRERFNQSVEVLQNMPFVLFMEIFLIGVPILLHAGIGFYIWIFSENTVREYPYLRNWLYSLQRWTGIITFLFIGYHVYKLRLEWTWKTNLTHIDYDYVKDYFSHTWHVLFYFVGIAAAAFHFADGLWNFLIKWGITIGERAQRASGYVCAMVGLGVFMFFMASLYAFA